MDTKAGLSVLFFLVTLVFFTSFKIYFFKGKDGRPPEGGRLLYLSADIRGGSLT
jgi:hypothetical protein